MTDTRHESLLDEVKQDLRAEHLSKLIKGFMPYFIGMAIMAVVFTAAKLWWDSYKSNVNAKFGGEYLIAQNHLNSYDLPAALAKFEEIGKSKSNFSAPALFFLASENYLKGGKLATKTYLSEIINSSVEMRYRELAQLSLYEVRIADDSEDKTKLLKEINATLATKFLFKKHLLELKILLLKAMGDKSYILEANKALEDPSLPHTLKTRLSLLLLAR
jgi:predicted negative regulator of RcsB-dependent stress response